MKTIVVGNVPPPVDGAGMVTAKAFTELARDHEVELFDCFDEHGRIMRDVISYVRVVTRLIGTDIRVAYIQGVQGERMLFVLVLLLAAKLTRTLVVHHHHAYKFIDSPSFLWRMICSSRFDVKHVVLSEGMGKRLESIYGNQSWQAVSNAAFVRSEFIGSSQHRSEDLVVLFAGVAGLGKGEDLVVEAVRQLRTRFDLPVKLILAGRGHSECENFVDVVGVLSSEELADCMRQAKVLALPSTYPAEAAPMVLYEAAATGTPMVASNRGCIPEISVELGGSISMVDPDSSELCDALYRSLMGSQKSSRISSDFLLAQAAALDKFANVLVPKPTESNCL